MIGWVIAAFAQLPDRRFLTVLAISALIAALAFGGVWAALDALVAGIDVTGWPGWLGNMWSFADDWIVALTTFALSFFLFTGIATAVMSLFLDSIVDAVETRHYKGWEAPRALGLGASLRMGLASAARLIGWNLLLLPLYLLLAFTIAGTFLLFLAVNGWLLGRDLLEMVLLRHRDPKVARAMIRDNGPLAFTIGVLTSAVLLMPILGIIGPLIGAAVATHAAHKLMAQAGASSHSERT